MNTSAISVNAEPITSAPRKITMSAPQKFVQRYFYFVMSLLLATLVVSGFQRTVDAHLFHAAVPRPRILWFHATAFAGWVLVFIAQSALVRVRKVSWHRLFGWFGAGLATVMVPLGVATSIVMARFDAFHFH